MRKLFFTTLLLTSMTTLVFATDNGGNGNGNGNGNVGSENGNGSGNGNVGSGPPDSGPPDNGPPDKAPPDKSGASRKVDTARNFDGCAGGDRNGTDRCCIYFNCDKE